MQNNQSCYLQWQSNINEKCKLSYLPIFSPTKTKKYNLNIIFATIDTARDCQTKNNNSILTSEQLSLLAIATQYNVPLPNLSDSSKVDWEDLHDQILNAQDEKKYLSGLAKMYGLNPDLYSLEELEAEILICQEEAEAEYSNELRWQRTFLYSTKL